MTSPGRPVVLITGATSGIGRATARRLAASGVFAIVLGLVLVPAAATRAGTAQWPPEKGKESVFNERRLEVFRHGIKKEWGYASPQRDTFLVLHPKQARPLAPLYVVLHSAGHDVHSCLACTTTVGNHDIYHSPADFFALYLDCRANRGDWWWGIEKCKGPQVSPTEKRVIDTVKWTIKQFDIDENRVYLCGNSMGGSGTLGIGIRHGDVFAAIKALAGRKQARGIAAPLPRLCTTTPPRPAPSCVKAKRPPSGDHAGESAVWPAGVSGVSASPSLSMR